MYVVTVLFEVDPSFIESFHDLVLKQAKNSLTNEQACRRFDVSFDPDQPHRCFLYELYDNREAFDAHVQTPYFAEFGAAIEGKVTKQLNCWVMAETD